MFFLVSIIELGVIFRLCKSIEDLEDELNKEGCSCDLCSR